jgi:hypothetical protein
LKLNVYTGSRSVATFEAARPVRNLFEDFQKKFKKTLKFPKTLSLPCLRCAAKRLRRAGRAGKKLQNFLKIFGLDPKVPRNPAVTGLDVAKKSQITLLFFA